MTVRWVCFPFEIQRGLLHIPFRLEQFVARTTWLRTQSYNGFGFSCVCFYIWHIFYGEVQASGGKNVRKQQLLPPACVWTLCRHMWKRAKTGIGTHAFMQVLRLGCCALANFSKAGPFLVKRQMHGKTQIQPVARGVVKMQFIKRWHLISSVWGVQLEQSQPLKSTFNPDPLEENLQKSIESLYFLWIQVISQWN